MKSKKQQAPKSNEPQQRPKRTPAPEKTEDELASLLAAAPQAGSLAAWPDHPTTLPLRQAAVLQMQKRQGNAYVQRMLATAKNTKGSVVQTKPAKSSEILWEEANPIGQIASIPEAAPQRYILWNFAVGSADLKPEHRDVLLNKILPHWNTLAAEPKFHDLRVSVEGHTSSSGSDKVNARLSWERAYTIYETLAMASIDPELMSIEGFGSTKPWFPNLTNRTKARNRRVEINLEPLPIIVGKIVSLETPLEKEISKLEREVKDYDELIRKVEVEKDPFWIKSHNSTLTELALSEGLKILHPTGTPNPEEFQPEEVYKRTIKRAAEYRLMEKGDTP